MPKKGKKLSEEKNEQLMEAYSDATAEALLDSAFGKWDQITPPNSRVPYLDRGDHIIIGGRTATELLMEQFNEEFPKMRNERGNPVDIIEHAKFYNEFREKKGKNLINQMITGALANGEKVEVFVPDKTTGKIKDQPMALTPRGYEPAGPLVKPKQLNGWQKFWNKFGFYKKEKAAVVNYEKESAARQKVQFCNKTARANLGTNYGMASAYREEMNKYHPEIREDMAENFPKANGNPVGLGLRNCFETSRSSFYSTMIQTLATKRDKEGKLLYTNEQLFDMDDPKMQKARADATKEVYEHYKAGDTDWLVDVQHDAATVLRARIDEQAAKLDFSKPDLTEQKGFRAFSMLSDTAFDQSQDMKHTKERLNERYGKGAYLEDAGKVGDCSQPYRHCITSLNAQKNLLNEVPGKAVGTICDQLALVLRSQAFQQHIGKTMKEHPEQKFSDITKVGMVTKATYVIQEAEYREDVMEEHEEYGTALPKLMEQNIKLAREHISNPEKFGKQIAGGVLEGRLKLRELTPDSEKPTEFEVRDAATVEREMKQQQRTGGGPEL